MLRKFITLLLFMIGLVVPGASVQAAPATQAQTIQFSGYIWQVRSATNEGPGPNDWSPNNVWVDSNGWLHLKISNVGGKWYAAEVYMNDRLGFGTYEWQVVGRVDQLHPNVVLGLFNYTRPDVGPGGTNEIDIEFTRWGNPAYPNGNYTVWPALSGFGSNSYTYNFSLNGDYSTHRFNWSASNVAYQSYHGHPDTGLYDLKQWNFAPSNPQQLVPQVALPVHMNLWIFKDPNTGAIQPNLQEVELVIRKFTFTPAGAATLPQAPTNLQVTTNASTQLNLTWNDNANNETGFKIERCQGAGCTNFSEIATVGANTTSFANGGLSAGTSYSYRLRATNSAGNSAYSNSASAVTTNPPTVPAAPNNLAVAVISTSQLNLTWSDVSTNETGFKLERCQGVGCTNFVQIATVGANITNFANTGLSAGTSYSYRLRATNSVGDSAYSNSASAVTTNPPAVPAMPTNLAVAVISASQLNLTWSDGSTNETGFRIDRCQGVGCINFAQIATVGVNATSYSNSGLAANTFYCYRVLAYNTTGNSPPSATMCANTAIAVPTNLTVVPGANRDLNVYWNDNSSNESGYQLERCSGAGCTNFTPLITLPANIIGYHNEGLTAGTTYCYRVRTTTANGNSAYSSSNCGFTAVVAASHLAEGDLLADTEQSTPEALPNDVPAEALPPAEGSASDAPGQLYLPVIKS